MKNETKKAEELCYGKFWLIATAALRSLYVPEVREVSTPLKCWGILVNINLFLEILQRQALALFDRKPSDSSDPGLGNGNAKLEKRDGCSDDEEMEEELKVDEQKHFQTAAAQLRPGFVTPAAFWK